jgi:uncharacterized Zn finger protein
LVKDHLSLEIINKLCIPSNFKYGSAIYSRGAVEIINQDPNQVEAWVGGLDGTVAQGAGTRRRTTFTITDGRLSWHCTGNPKNHDIFCKHCVALALVLVN